MKNTSIVDIWIIQYPNIKALLRQDKHDVVCLKEGHLCLHNRFFNDQYWLEEVWHLLNWSCWTDKKPKCVKSRITCCNSDIILNIRGTNDFHYCKNIGWGVENSLEQAFKSSVHEQRLNFNLYF